MDAYEARKRDWEDLEVTREELKSLTECLKKDECRKWLIEYAEEVNNPENRKIYQKEMTQLEKERGVDVTFVNPEPGYVIKTSVDGDKKCFLNISKSDIVARPSSHPSFEEGHRGLQWSIPYTLIPPRDDLDKKNIRCMVFDVVFHPDTIYLTSKNERFREIVNNTAMDGVENNFQVKLDRRNVRFPKMSYKGASHPAVIRKPSKEPPKEPLDMEPKIYQKLIDSYDENRARHTRTTEKKPQRVSPPTTYYKEQTANTNVDVSGNANTEYVTPKFSIKHRNDIDLEDFGVGRDSKMYAATPKKLVITVDLPLLKTAADAALDVQEQSISLKSEKPAKYMLDLPLPYCVDGDQGNAKFDSKYKKLTITLPVVRPMVPIMNTRGDIRLESDNLDMPLSSDSNADLSSTIRSGDSASKLVEECDPELAPTMSQDDSGVGEECSDTALRTSNTEDDEFMDSSIKYSLPAFNCNIYDNQLAVTIHVKNVDPESIRHRILHNNRGVHILLVSVGAGFYPQHYSLCLKIRENSVESNSLTVEPWDNNVVFTIMLKNAEDLAVYYFGITEEFLEQRDLPTAASFKNKLNELMGTENVDSQGDLKIKVEAQDKTIVVNAQSSQLDSDDEAEHEDSTSAVRWQNRRHILPKSRSVSESSGDEGASNGSSTGGHSKGILKSRRTHGFSRSMSESSADENGVLVSSMDYHSDSVQDLNSESDCSSLKKTVRFNDVVSRQLFRSNSSILGQRKKNQRKLRNKKRAHKRRMSESENSETEERDKYKANPKDASDQESSETVKPILHQEKQPEKHRTANIEIEKAKNSNNISMHKRKSNAEDTVANEAPPDGTIEVRENAAKVEFKNDLIFDLDM